MAILKQGQEGFESSSNDALGLPKLRWLQIFAVSIFWFALNFHWSALGIIILPSQVFKLVGELQKGEALALILVPGAFVSLFANPLFGMLSDETRGRFARIGRRRPYILLGTLVNVTALVWMALARDILSLALAYAVIQFSNNAATAPFHALLPDIVPKEQRGLASGVMGLLATLGSISGVILSGLFIDASKPFDTYQHGLWLTYGIIIAVMLSMMLITIGTVRERDPQEETSSISIERTTSAKTLAQSPTVPIRRTWLTRKMLFTIFSTLLAVGVAWGIMVAWNALKVGNIQISNDVQQVVLEVVATLGILRLFDFHPRRNPDFAWVLLTRLVMTLGIYTVQDFLQFYMRDAVCVAHPEAQTTNFVIILSLTSLLSAFAAGWLSDRFGRKRMVYFSGGFMAVVGLIFIITQSLPIVLAAGAIFGLGYGAYISVDWALVADVLPSKRNYARDMGVWNISQSLPQVIAPVIGGPLLDFFTKSGHPVLGFQILFGMAIVYCLIGTVTVRYIRGVQK
jgi:MFS family permease